MKDIVKYFDKFNFFLLLALSVGGVVLIHSAGLAVGKPYYLRQLLWLLVSLLVFYIVFSVKLEIFFRYSQVLYVGLVAVLVLQLVLGRTVAGTKSWFQLGGLNMQFSELVKIPLALVLAKYLTQFEVINGRVFFRLLMIVGIALLPIALQPDFGVSFILCSFFLTTILLKRIRWTVVALTLVMVFGVATVAWRSYLKPYQKNRIVSFLHPELYKDSLSYHIYQSKIAVGSGGLTGKGYLKGSQNQYQFLPKRHTDFIISVVGEEFGFVGISILLFVFALFFYVQSRFKFLNDEEFYFVYLFNGLIFFQFLVNTCMAIGLFPVLGVPLPFVSYGGSSLLSFFIGEALIFRIKINNYLTD
jgi:rod shape determining protein RodA